MDSEGLVHEHLRVPWQGAGAPPLTQLALHSCDKDRDQQQPGDGRIYLILQLIGHTPSLREVIAVEECC